MQKKQRGTWPRWVNGHCWDDSACAADVALVWSKAPPIIAIPKHITAATAAVM
ncbi:MAG TPA: hypothetical protein PLW99_01615 [Candidatus Paceibacterota bacterium]|nr:hypothetical protein [Candidatus Paceibacterota bacterium]